jgi:dTDP-4-dehydrorhamnose reductase
MRIVVTGRDGQVVRALAERGAPRGHDIIALGRPNLDLAGDGEAIISALVDARPDAIVSAAAYTAVDKAESEPEQAARVNINGAEAVARAAKALEVPLIHLSTDYVFDGAKDGAYVEDDVTRPTGVYGRTKLAGEQAVLAAHDDVAILRTAWVYSPFGANFLKTMLRLAGERDEVSVVADQRGNPTSALDIADAIVTIAEQLAASRSPALRGIFHMTGAGEATWADFAEAIFAASAASNGPSAAVRRITTEDFPTPAKRPANSRLDCERLAEAHAVRLPDWPTSTAVVVARLLGAGPGLK